MVGHAGLPAKYKDPKTGLPYATVEAYRVIRARYGEGEQEEEEEEARKYEEESSRSQRYLPHAQQIGGHSFRRGSHFP